MALALTLSITILVFDLLLNLFYLQKVLKIYMKYRITAGFLFLILFVTRCVILLVQGFGLISYPEREMLSDTIAFGGIVVGFLYILILESYWSPIYDSRRLSLAAALSTLTGTFILLSRNSIVAPALIEAFPFFIQLTVPVVFFFFAYSVNRLTTLMLKYASDVQRRPFQLIRLNVLLTYIGAPLFIMSSLIATTTPDNPLPAYNDQNLVLFTLIPSLFYFVMDAFWYFAVIRYDSLSFLQVTRVDRLLVTNKYGAALYEYTPVEDATVDENLFSAALFAIQAVLKEGANISGTLKLIQIGEFYLIFRQVGGVSVILFTRQTSKFLNDATSLIARELSTVIDPESTSVDIEKIEKTVKSILAAT